MLKRLSTVFLMSLVIITVAHIFNKPAYSSDCSSIIIR